MSTSSQLAEDTAGNAKFVFHYKVGHVMRQPGVIARGWLHPR
jgi:hypothetical protein